jgi:hypothetical protein
MKNFLLNAVAILILMGIAFLLIKFESNIQKNSKPQHTVNLSPQKTITPVFTINLPLGMKLASQQISKETNTYSYIFQFDNSADTMLVVVTPVINNRELKSYTIEPALLVLEQKYHLDPNFYKDFVVETYEEIQQYFYDSSIGGVVIARESHGAAYTITVISPSIGSQVRDHEMLDSTHTIEFLGLPAKTNPN